MFPRQTKRTEILGGSAMVILRPSLPYLVVFLKLLRNFTGQGLTTVLPVDIAKRSTLCGVS
jgi:hypothetical protein